MVDPTKHLSVVSDLVSDVKSLCSLSGTRRSVAFAYGLMFAFVTFAAFLALRPPSGNSSYPWFNNIFSTTTATTTTAPTSDPSAPSSYRSQFSSISSYFFPDSSRSFPAAAPYPSPSPPSQANLNFSTPNNTTSQLPTNIDDVKNQSQSTAPSTSNQKPVSSGQSQVLETNRTATSVVAEKARLSNLTASLSKKMNNRTRGVSPKKPRKANWFDSLMHCDIFYGSWVRDDSHPLYPPGSCSHIDESFNCFLNGRPDGDYQKLRWQPKGCTLPRLNGKHMLELLRGKRLVFVGDSLNRNMWESLICILKNSVKDKSKVFEAAGRHEFRTEGSYSFIFEDYNSTVEYFRSPFLVQEWEIAETNGSKKETLRLDTIERKSDYYITADILIFNTGHWWTHEKTSKGKDYYQEGSHVYEELNVDEAFHKALTTWARWVDANVDPKKTLVLFRGYSASHFSGGQWNSGGQCDDETEPIKNETYLSAYPPKMKVLESVMETMKTPVSYLNITRMTDYRKDAHPSVFRKQNLTEEERRSPLRYQDCSHWCLPGVPDVWNELFYAKLIIKHTQKQKKKLQQQSNCSFKSSNRIDHSDPCLN